MKKYILREKSYKFSIELIKFLGHLTVSKISYPILNQLIRSGTSIGANIEEADSSSTRKDFKHKATISKKEAAESIYWLRIIMDSNMLKNEQNILKAKELLEECNQILRILSTIIRKIE